MMNGISLVISKPCCPMYNFGSINNNEYCTGNKIRIYTSNKTDLIPCRVSSLLHRRISYSVAIKPLVKHRVYSSHAGKAVLASRFEALDVSSTAVPYGLLGLLGVVGSTLPIAWEFVLQFISAMTGKEGLLKSSASYYFCLGVVAVFAFKGLFGNIICGFSVLYHKPFSTGDIIEVGNLKCQVLQMGLKKTTVLSAEKHTIEVPTSWFHGQVIVNKSRGTTLAPYSFFADQKIVKKPPVVPFHAMDSKIYLEYEDNIKEIYEISEEITKMMISHPNVYLETRTPSCKIDVSKTYCELTLVCHLKQASEDVLCLEKQAILLLSAQIIKKHGAKLTHVSLCGARMCYI